MKGSTLLCFFLVLAASIIDVLGHNYLTNPVSRADQRDTQTGCRVGNSARQVPNCPGPCDRSVSQATIAPIAVQRGQALQINWYRHTHPGGFIRFACSPTSQSDSHSSFDSHVDRIVCKEIGGCGPSDPSQPSSTTNGIDCGTTITVPLYLTDGTWTLQWAYFGGWYNAGDYYACVDYVVSGGPTGPEQPAVYIGGDYTYPNQDVCLFYSTNALHVCVVEPCLTGTFPAGNQVGPAAGFSSTPSPTPSPSPPPAPLTTHAATTHAATTHAATTHAATIQAATTHAATTHAPATPPSPPPSPITTQAKTTGKTPSIVTTGTSTSTSSSSSSISTSTSSSSQSCTTGYMQCLTSNSYRTCAHSAWGPSQPCSTGTSCHSSGNYIYCY